MKNPKQFRTILFISLDAFFASVEQALRPKLRGQPVVVRGNLEFNKKVASYNYEAKQLGITKSIPLKKIYSLAPNANVITGSFDHYEKFSEEFYKILSCFSNKIEPVSLDEAYLELDGFEQNWINSEEVAKEIRKRIHRELEITTSIGIASNKICAKVAANKNKPNGLVYVPWEYEKEFLNPLSIGYLPSIGARTARVLNSIGINTIGQLASKSPNLLIQTFGSNGQWLWQVANGIDNRLVSIHNNRNSVSRSSSFSYATKDGVAIKSTLYFLLARACTTLQNERQAGKTISVFVRYANDEFKARQKTFTEPASTVKYLYPTSKQLLAELYKKYVSIKTIGVVISNLQNKTQDKKIFLNSIYNNEKIKNSLALIKNRFGFTSVY